MKKIYNSLPAPKTLSHHTRLENDTHSAAIDDEEQALNDIYSLPCFFTHKLSRIHFLSHSEFDILTYIIYNKFLQEIDIWY